MVMELEKNIIESFTESITLMSESFISDATCQEAGRLPYNVNLVWAINTGEKKAKKGTPHINKFTALELQWIHKYAHATSYVPN